MKKDVYHMDFIERLFPGYKEKLAKGICPNCDKSIGKFRDKESQKRYRISGICQKCLDKTLII